MNNVVYGDFGDLSERRILGFDARVNPNKQISAFSDDWRRKKLYAQESMYLLALDPEIWSPIESDSSNLSVSELTRHPFLRNGYNLLFEVSEELIEIIRMRNETDVVVAFDIPAFEYDAISGTFGHGCNQPDIDATTLQKNGWIFLGFDVVDPRTQLSGLVSVDYDPNEQEMLPQESERDINVYGLFSHVNIARSVSEITDKLIPDHAPFCPCGVWLGVANAKLILE